MPGNPRDIGSITRALRQQPVIGLQTFLINKGRGFGIPHRVEDVSNEENIRIFVNNPDGSGFDYDIVLLPRANGLCDVDVSYGATEGDAGEAGVEQNLKSGSDRTFSGETRLVESGDTGTQPSHGTTIFEDFVPGNGQGANIGGQVIGSVATTIDEGSNKLFEMANVSSGSIDRMAINLLIFEVDGTYKEIE